VKIAHPEGWRDRPDEAPATPGQIENEKLKIENVLFSILNSQFSIPDGKVPTPAAQAGR
jgi:hypothetical protein